MGWFEVVVLTFAVFAVLILPAACVALGLVLALATVIDHVCARVARWLGTILGTPARRRFP